MLLCNVVTSCVSDIFVWSGRMSVMCAL